jgi:acyl carrier protein
MIDRKKLFALVSDALGVEVGIDSSSENVEEWDSLGRLSIISALDQKTNGRAGAVSALANCSSMVDLIAVIEDHKLYW